MDVNQIRPYSYYVFHKITSLKLVTDMAELCMAGKDNQFRKVYMKPAEYDGTAYMEISRQFCMD